MAGLLSLLGVRVASLRASCRKTLNLFSLLTFFVKAKIVFPFFLVSQNRY